MRKYTFKENGKDNNLIISGIIKFAQKHYMNKNNLFIVGDFPKFPCRKMLHKDHITYFTCEVFDEKQSKRNYILQFAFGPHEHPVGDDSTIWMSKGSKITFTENEIVIMKPDRSEVLFRHYQGIKQ